MEEEKKYYVYEWFNTNTKEVFYVGSGKNGRWKETSKYKRNDLFVNYYNSNNCDVRKVIEGLTKKEARKIEEEITDEYKKIGQCFCNKNSGNKISPEERKRRSEANKGEKNPMYGKKFSNEHRKKLSEGQRRRLENPEERKKMIESRAKRPVLQFNSDWKFIKSYKSTKEAHIENKILSESIYKCCKGYRNFAGSYRWMYEDEYLDLLNYAF